MKKYQKTQNQVKNGSFFRSVATGVSLAIIALFVAMSCGKKDDEPTKPDPYLKVEPATVVFSDAGGKQTVTVSTNIEGWSFKVDNNSWVTAAASPTNSNVI